jgi:hypothetical protein
VAGFSFGRRAVRQCQSPADHARGIEALKDEPDQDVLGIRFILSQLARAVVIASVPSIQRSTATPWPWRRTTMPIRRNLAPHALEADAVVRPDLLAFKAFAKDAFEQPAD